MKTEHIELLNRLEACVLDDSAAAFLFCASLNRLRQRPQENKALD